MPSEIPSNRDRSRTRESLRTDAIAIWNAGVDAVRAAPLVHRRVAVEGDQLVIDQHQWSRRQYDGVTVVGAGKAGTAMTEGLLDSIAGWLPISGWVNVPEGTEKELPGIQIHPARPAGVNEPTPQGVAGTNEILRRISNADSRQLCIALISGGGSALLPAPIDGISLEDKVAVTRFLSGAGADITQLNVVRKHLSAVKGGGLLRACRAGHLVTLILSDVLGDPLDLIASGPTVPDPSSAADALDVLTQFDPDATLPPQIRDALQRGLEAERESGHDSDERNTCPATTIVLGNNALAVDEAGIVAESLGYNHAMQSATACEGSAEAVGRHLADMAIEMLSVDPSQHRTDCLITGGEPIVALAPPERRGRGGRNQQLVLAAYQRLLAKELSEDHWQRIAILSGGTDGEDGPTDAAGAVLDADVHRRATERGLDVDDALRRNDAYSFFESAGGLLMTGPTGTNVCDVRVLVLKTD